MIYEGEYEPGNDGIDVEVWVIEVAASDNHVVGVIGEDAERVGVVDTSMKMHGIENVRVVGAFRLAFFFLFF